VLHRAQLQYQRNGCSEALMERLTKHLASSQSDTLTVGFARRFATYKRATLLFSDPQRLKRLLNNPECPVVLIFAGKAHPSDAPGQALIRKIHEFSIHPDFIGRIILLEGYDLALARKLVTGVDVWLNTPEYPLEASGTSGQKAGMNGVLNLSVLDGWWDEGYNGENGWAIAPHAPHFDADYRNQEESSELLELLENQVIPTYYDRKNQGYSEKWVRLSKASMKSCIPLFNAQRMVRDYIRNYYSPASRQSKAFAANGFRGAGELAGWKQKVGRSWPEVTLRRVDDSEDAIISGSSLMIKVAAKLGGLTPNDVIVECLIGTQNTHTDFAVSQHLQFEAAGINDKGEALFQLDLLPPLSGLQFYKIRIYPFHRLLSHRFETGHMIWL
jgi:starch phosphorylase